MEIGRIRETKGDRWSERDREREIESGVRDMWHGTTVAVGGSGFNKVKAKNNTRRIHFVNETNQKLKQFQPHVRTKHMNQYSVNNILQQRQHIFDPRMYYASPMEPK